MSGGGSSGGGGTTVQKSEPWDKAKPEYEALYAAARNAYGQTSKDGYSGPMLAPADPLQAQAKESLLSTVPTLQSNANTLQQFANDTASGKYLSAASNPYLQETINASIQPTLQNFTEAVVPSINSAAIRGGAYGGARNGLALGRAAQGTAQEVLNTAAKIGYQNY